MKLNRTLSVVVADTSAIVRCGMSTLLKRLTQGKFIAVEVASLDALHHTLRSHEVDFVLVGPTFGGGINISELRQHYPHSGLRYVALLTHLTAPGLLLQYDSSVGIYDEPEDIISKLEQLVQQEEEDGDSSQETLSLREKEIVCAVVKGLTNKEIAEQLFISVHTVITHRRNISRKLQIHSPAGLTIYAIVNKLVDIQEVAVGQKE